MTNKQLDKIISESIKNTLIKEDLYPTDNEGNMKFYKKNCNQEYNAIKEFIETINRRFGYIDSSHVSNKDIADFWYFVEITLDSHNHISDWYKKVNKKML